MVILPIDFTPEICYNISTKERKVHKMKLILGLLVLIIGLLGIYLNDKSNSPKNWIAILGYVVALGGIGILATIN